MLATGNKSELSVGYSTIYGDAVGGFAPLKDVPKTLVWALARWRNAEAAKRGEVAPDPGEHRSPSHRQRSCGPDSSTRDSLPEYDLLDDVLDDYVEGDRGAATIWSPPASTPRSSNG